LNAFLEWFLIGGMVRVGPEAFSYDDPYEFAVGFKVSPWQFIRRILGFKAWAVLTGTHAPKNGSLSLYKEYKFSAQSALNRAGYAVYSERRKNGKVTIIMAKKPIPDISEIFNADGTLNETKGMSGLSHAMNQIKEGHYSIGNGKASQTTNGKVTSISISFDRTEK
jgi:hypothetical protein